MPDAGAVAGDVTSGAAMGATAGSIVPGLGTAIGAGIGAIGGLITGLLAKGDDPQIRAQLTAIYNRYGSLNPQIIAQKEQAFQAQGDPVSRSMQLDALSNLKNLYSSGGLDAIAKQRLAQSVQAGQQGAAQNEAMLEEQMRRENPSGAGPASAVLALQRGQGALTLGGNQAMDAAAIAEQNRLGALGQAGQLSTAAGSQANQLAEFNALAQQGVAERNANRAQLAQQQSFGNQMGILEGQTGATTALNPESTRQRAQDVNTGAGASTAIGGLAAYGVDQIGGGAGGPAPNGAASSSAYTPQTPIASTLQPPAGYTSGTGGGNLTYSQPTAYNTYSSELDRLRSGRG